MLPIVLEPGEPRANLEIYPATVAALHFRPLLVDADPGSHPSTSLEPGNLNSQPLLQRTALLGSSFPARSFFPKLDTGFFRLVRDALVKV